MQEPPGTFNLGTCLEYGWSTFKKDAGPYVVASLVLFLAYAAAHVAASRLRGGGIALNLLLGPIYWICAMSIARAGARGRAPTVGDAFRPFTERQGDYLMVALAIASGAILCFVGVIASWFVCFFAPLMALDGRDFKQAVIDSKNLVFKYPGDVALLALVASGLNLAGVLACGIGVIISTPIVCLMIVKAYEQLLARSALAAPSMPMPPPV